MLSAPILNVAAISKTYGEAPAVREVSFAIHAGEIVGLLGPNGAGKTSTINMVLGVLTPDAGQITIDGYALATHRPRALANTNFAAVYAPLPGNLTVRQNLAVFAKLYGVANARARIAELMAQYDLGPLADTKCGVLSSGEQTRVALAKALLNAPRLLLLDEPTASLDPATARQLRSIIKDTAAREQCAVLWTSHNMAEVETVCDRVLFMSRGRIIAAGPPQSLLRQHGVASLEALFIQLANEPLVAA